MTLKTLNKSNVWDIQENDIFRLWEAAEKEADLKDNVRHYTDIIKSAFEMEEVKVDKPEVIKKYEARDFKIGTLKIDESAKIKFAIKKKPILRVTDLTYENIRHISAPELLSLLEANFGSGWESLSLQIRDVIETGFDISTTQLPTSRIHTPGGTLSKKVAQGYDVLEIPRGTWTEAIFAKKKDPVAKIRFVVPEARFDEDGNPLPDDEALSDGNADDQDDQNDDTFYSSYAAEANAKAEDEEAEAEGMEIE